MPCRKFRRPEALVLDALIVRSPVAILARRVLGTDARSTSVVQGYGSVSRPGGVISPAA